MKKQIFPKEIRGAVIVAALGYFVDVYDLLIFSIVRVASLRGIGIPEDQMLDAGLKLLNTQMTGMLVGGILWGVLGDKKGRISVLMGSIFLYSAANILNGFVINLEQYALCRFIAGVGLAGELGAGITLVSELMHKDSRGVGTTLVASIGLCGAILAALIGDKLSWQNAYFVGGGLGMALLFLRVAVRESGLFRVLKSKNVNRGNLIDLFRSSERLLRYVKCILIGLPIWFVIGILVTFSPEFGRAFGVEGAISAANSVLFAYIGLASGDLSSGLLSQFFRSRRKVLFGFILLTALSIFAFLFGKPHTAQQVYWLCFPLGFAVGYWAVFVTNAAEQFGTNLRATVATSVPNFVRGAVVPITYFFEYFKKDLGIIQSATLVGSLCVVIALLALLTLEESFGKDLNFVEEV